MDDEHLVIIGELRKENRELRETISRLHEKLKEKESKINELQEEINELKEDNQKLRQEIFGFKSSKKRQRRSNANTKQKKRGPPYGHKGTSRKRPDEADTTIVLELEACPYCDGELKELE